MTRRGGRDVEAAIRRVLAQRERQLNPVLKKLDQNLELITSLRRIEKKPDPLEITVTNLDKLTAGTRALPVLQVELKNVDSEKQSVWFTEGGNNRSGRHARWRIHVRDAQGKLLPQRPSPSSERGGLVHPRLFDFGEVWTADLPMSRYVQVPSAGEYTVQILYHNELTIADFSESSDLNGLILFQSRAFKLKVEDGPKISIHVRADVHATAKSLIRGFEGNGRLKIVLGPYEKELHEFIRPDSVPGKLLALKLKAVPALLDSLDDESLPLKKRAWILALLYSLVGDESLDPRGALSSYLVEGSPNSVTSSSSGLSMSYDGGKSSFFGGESAEELQTLTTEWKQFRKNYLVIDFEKPSPAP